MTVVDTCSLETPVFGADSATGRGGGEGAAQQMEPQGGVAMGSATGHCIAGSAKGTPTADSGRVYWT